MEKVKLINDEKGVRLYIDGKKVYSSKKTPNKMKVLTLEDFGVKKNKDGEYHIKKQIIVNRGEKLVIKPGSVIIIDEEIKSANQSIYVNGSDVFLRGSIVVLEGMIEAIGIKEEPIIFKSSGEEKYCNAIELRNSNNSKFEWCKFNNMMGLLEETDRWYIDSGTDTRIDGLRIGSGIYAIYNDNLVIKNCEFNGGICEACGGMESDIYLLKCRNTEIENISGLIENIDK